MGNRFSDRHGLTPTPAEITVRDDAPEEFRGVLVDLAYKHGMRPTTVRSLVCSVLMKRADDSNWSDFPNVDSEVRGLLDDAEWFEVYDVVEAIYSSMPAGSHDPFSPSGLDSSSRDGFEDDLNTYFVRRGIGWKLTAGQLEVRGPEAFEMTVTPAVHRLEAADLTTAAGQLHEALGDLARRPKPDLTGAIQHALAALECVARTATGDANATLGVILKRHPGIVPPPLDQALARLWGYGSGAARHIKEGTSPEYAEAELVVLTCAAAATYLEKVIEGSGDV